MDSTSPISQISNVEKGLGGINKQLDTSISKLKQLVGLAGTTFSSVKQILNINMGQGTNLALGSSNAQFSSGTGGTGSNNVMPWAYSKQGAATIGGVQLGLGLAGGAYSALPDLATVMPRAMGTFQASVRMPGVNQAALQRMSFNAIRGGITGTGEDIAAMNMLVNGYGMIGQANFTQSMQEVRGAALNYGMANATAAQAIGSMHTGATSGNLYQYGISTLDTKTGKVRPMDQIAQQIYQRVMGNRKLTPAQLEFSMREGTLNKTINDLVTDPAANQLVRNMMTPISQGQSASMLNATGTANPAANTAYKIATSNAELANKTQDALILGYGDAATAVSKLNKALEGTPEAILRLKGAAQGVSGTSVGNLSSGLISGITGAAGTYLAYKGLQKFASKAGVNALSKVGGGAVTTAAEIATSTGAGKVLLDQFGKPIVTAAEKTVVKTGAEVAGKVALGAAGKLLPIAGGAVSAAIGQSFLSSVATSALVGGAFAGAASGGAAAIPGALVAGGLDALGWLGAKAVKAMSSKPPVVQGNKSQQEWAVGLLGKLGAPVTDQNIQAMTTWMAFEGGHWKNNANYNPLNTTQNEKGAKSINKVGVKAYQSWDQGYQATVETLKNGKYTNVLSALQQGTDSSAVLGAVNASPWGTKIPGYAATGTTAGSTSTGQTVNINLTISRASDAEAIAFAKKVKDLLLKDKTLNAIGSK
jgi:hypothetical protein